ncbi:MAG: tetratricopeptide repeat protein [Candidatus Omnitrophota bacterium]
MKDKTTGKQKIILIAVGFIMTVIFVETGMRLSGFVFKYYQSYKNHQALKETGAYRILCIGESTTFSGTLEHSYPYQLEKILNQKNLGIKFRVINEGILGVTSGIILSNLKENLSKYAPDMVITMIGINDGRNDVTEEVLGNDKDNWFILAVKRLKVYRLLNHIRLHAQSRNSEKEEDYVLSHEDPRMTKLMEQVYDYMDRLEFDEAELVLKKAMKIDPDYSPIYSNLGGIYSYYAEMDLAVSYLKRAIELDPKNEEAYSLLSMRYFYAMKYSLAEETVLAMIQNIPDSDEAYEKLAQIYFKQKEYDKLEQVLQKADEKFPDSYIFSKMWASYYLIQGKVKEAEEKFIKAADLDAQYLSPLTVDNYRQIKEIVLSRGIKLVSVQYPMRKLDPLVKMLGKDRNVVFVDNEKIFKDALSQKPYEQYFVDNFAGDFGHLSTDGIKLIAGNIADVITQSFFKE